MLDDNLECLFYNEWIRVNGSEPPSNNAKQLNAQLAPIFLKPNDFSNACGEVCSDDDIDLLIDHVRIALSIDEICAKNSAKRRSNLP